VGKVSKPSVEKKRWIRVRNKKDVPDQKKVGKKTIIVGNKHIKRRINVKGGGPVEKEKNSEKSQ